LRNLCSRAAVAVALCAALLRSGFAEDRPPEYEEAFKRGTELFNAGDYAAAREQVTRAYEIHPEPLLLLSIGSTYRREGELEPAVDHYRRFMSEADADDEYRATAQGYIDALEAEIAEQRKREAEAEANKPPPPRAPIVIPELAPAPVNDSGRGLRITGIATVAVGAVLVGVGVQQGLHAGNVDDELAAASGPWTPERQERFNDGEAAETRAIVFGVTGGVAVATGAALYWIGHRKDGRAERDGVAIAPYRDGPTTGLAVSGAF
jgi:tetratricopeptide (TPR) repeat protein